MLNGAHADSRKVTEIHLASCCLVFIDSPAVLILSTLMLAHACRL